MDVYTRTKNLFFYDENAGINTYSRTSMARTPLEHENMFCSRQGWFELRSVNYGARSGGIKEIYF